MVFFPSTSLMGPTQVFQIREKGALCGSSPQIIEKDRMAISIFLWGLLLFKPLLNTKTAICVLLPSLLFCVFGLFFSFFFFALRRS